MWPLPRSLVNIYTELRSDLGVVPPRHGDLTGWSDQGVMLLNRVLTVRPGESASHRGKGWEEVTECAIRALVARAEEGQPLAAVLWGRDAQSLKPVLGTVPWVESVHPSPLSASRGFFGSRPFSRVDRLLGERGAAIRWTGRRWPTTTRARRPDSTSDIVEIMNDRDARPLPGPRRTRHCSTTRSGRGSSPPGRPTCRDRRRSWSSAPTGSRRR